MFKEEWKWFHKHKFFYLILGALILVPTIYTVVFLSSLWNPYDKVRNLDVAVVNNDKQQIFKNKKIDIGNELVKTFKKSKDASFKIVDKNKAEKGLKDDKYYMIIDIPKDFSKNAVSILNKKPKQMKLSYETNPGSSFVGDKMMQTAAKEVIKQVSADVTNMYGHVLVTSIKKFGAGTKEASDGNSKLATGALKIQQGNNEIATNSNQLVNGSVQLATGAQNLKNGMMTYLNSVSKANQGSREFYNGLTGYTNGIQQVATANNQLNTSLNQLNSKLNSASSKNNIGQIQNKINNMQNEYNNLQPALKGISSINVNEINNNLNTINSSMSNLKNAILIDNKNRTVAIDNAVNNSNNITDEQKGNLINQLNTTLINTNQTSNLNKLLTSNAMQNLKNSTLNLQTILNNQAKYINTLNNLQKNMTSLQGVNVSSQIQQVNLVSNAINQITNGSNKLTSGLNSINNKSSLLKNSAFQLNNGLTQISNQNGNIINGINQLATGANTISEGNKKLSVATNQVTNKLGLIVNGNKDIANKLSLASDQANKIHANKTVYNQIAEPLKGQQKEQNHVANNGTGMTPYMFSVGLYVGMVSFTVMIDLITPRKKPKNFLGWFGAKLSVVTFYAVISSSLVYLLSKWVLKLKSVNELGTYLMLLLTAMTFGLIVTSIVLWLKRPGSFVAIVFLVLQLSGAAGVYPIQISNSFFKAINPYLPMTYTVKAFRETIMIGNSPWPYAIVLLIISAVFLIIMGSYYLVNMNKYSSDYSIEKNK